MIGIGDSSSAQAAGAPKAQAHGRLLELDVLRALAALGVIVIHVTASPLAAGPGNGYANRPLQAAPFWRKRLSAVGLPYLVWSISYALLVARLGHVPFWKVPRLAGLAILQSTAMYQLYFVVLILQFYLLFPILHPLRDLAKRHTIPYN